MHSSPVVTITCTRAQCVTRCMTGVSVGVSKRGAGLSTHPRPAPVLAIVRSEPAELDNRAGVVRRKEETPRGREIGFLHLNLDVFSQYSANWEKRPFWPAGDRQSTERSSVTAENIDDPPQPRRSVLRGPGALMATRILP